MASEFKYTIDPSLSLILSSMNHGVDAEGLRALKLAIINHPDFTKDYLFY